MSELREHLFVPYSELQEGDELTDAFTIAKSYCLKSEADKAIARHKYKRCLAMAAYCNAKIEEYQANYDADEGFGDEWLYWIKFMRKWMRRWHEFAEKFKEAK